MLPRPKQNNYVVRRYWTSAYPSPTSMASSSASRACDTSLVVRNSVCSVPKISRRTFSSLSLNLPNDIEMNYIIQPTFLSYCLYQ